MTRKRNIQFDPSGAPASPATAAVVEPVVVTEPVVEIPSTDPVITNSSEHFAEVEALLKGTTAKPEEPVVPEVVKTPEEIEAAKKVAEAKPTEPVVEPVVSDEDALDIPALEVVEPEVTETFAQVATDIGIAPPANPDDYEAFVANAKQAILDAEKRGEEKASAPDPDKFGPEERLYLNALKGGKKVADVLLPLEKYNDTLMLSNRDLVELNYKNIPNWTPEMVADKMAILDQTDGAIDIEGLQLRALVKTARTNELNAILAQGEQAWKDESARQSTRLDQEKQALIAELRSRKDYMGAPLSDQHIEALVNNVNAGKYNKTLNTAKSVADQILNHEFKDKRMSALLSKKEKDGKIAVAKNLANTPVESGGSHVEANKKSIDPNDHFAGVAEFMKDKKVTGSTFGR